MTMVWDGYHDDYKEIVYKDEKGDETKLKIGDLETLTKLAVETMIMVRHGYDR